MAKVSATKPTCKPGNQLCGFTCIDPKKKTCRLSAKASKALDSLVAGAVKGSADVVPDSKLRPTLLDRLSKASDQKAKREAAKIASNRLSPSQLKTVLDNEIAPGVTIRDFGTSQGSVGVYDLPNMKRRQVDDDEVEAVWEGMSSQQRNLILPVNAGAPDRDAKKDPNADSYKNTDWGGNNELMRKSMLKAMLEQTDDNGDVIDPWTGSKLEFPADLDHIVPLAKGGGHGGRVGRQVNTGIESSNWVWIEPKINRNYKNDRDIHDTVTALLKHEAEGVDGYNEALDATIKKYEGSKAQQAKLRKQTIDALKGHLDPTLAPGTYPELPDPTVIRTMSGKETDEVFKALRDAKLIPPGGFGKQKLTKKGTPDIPEPQYQKAVAQLYETVKEEQEMAKAKVELTNRVKQIRENGLEPPVQKLPSNKAVKGIIQNSVDKLSFKQQHRVLDKFMSAYDRPGTDQTLPQEIRDIWNEGIKNPIPRGELSSSPWSWSRGGRDFPDLNSLPPAQRDRLWRYLQDSFS